MHEQKLKENGLGYIDPKQNRVITTHGFGLLSVIGQQIKQITVEKCVNMFSHTNFQIRLKLLIYVEAI
jgi:hypothetical protein